MARGHGHACTRRSPDGQLRDAFAVCNYLGLYQALGQSHFLELALLLVEQVHEVLGRHHPDEAHTGWLSGLDDEEQRAHPPRAGLRIGKEFRERTADEPFDDGLEWQRDGQYFHYLTRWMHALEQVARVTRDERYHYWAVYFPGVLARAGPPAGSDLAGAPRYQQRDARHEPGARRVPLVRLAQSFLQDAANPAGVFIVVAALWAPRILQFEGLVEYFQPFPGYLTMTVVLSRPVLPLAGS